ncbi:hypothetical protein F4776DRAFT_575424 [Hypoxylon sp. NC0597]|nr:hypothetical protein F4776DRAFT_575424 [Hypoxylon sp. NC0597]
MNTFGGQAIPSSRWFAILTSAAAIIKGMVSYLTSWPDRLRYLRHELKIRFFLLSDSLSSSSDMQRTVSFPLHAYPPADQWLRAFLSLFSSGGVFRICVATQCNPSVDLMEQTGERESGPFKRGKRAAKTCFKLNMTRSHSATRRFRQTIRSSFIPTSVHVPHKGMHHADVALSVILSRSNT